ncbi:putative protein N(5)-glutamine methyltransferase [Bacillus sp. FJAT-49736]|uniref:putative protein N(5)-glutamine methyltransferase n=1 Tax=Bacillus sp. FJAT-49736 TaxID=2833582 RepID=UPI002016889C|nr:putative protein N(5)-glutamine methyltransferase [Bacillus sp. FJAT-49736]
MDNHTENTIVNKLRNAGCVFAEDEAQLLISEAYSLEDLIRKVEKRVGGLPLEYVIGWAHFCGLRIAVERGVFVPRQRTEFLVRHAKELAGSGDVVVDLCCGSGAIGAALAAALDDLSLYCSDIDPIAIRCARRNMARFGGQVFEGDLYKALPQPIKGYINILVANVPYVPTKAIDLLPTEARLYEPNLALDGGDDGLNILSKVVEEAPFWLAPGGHLLIETSEMQATQTFEIFVHAGFATEVVRDAELDATVVIGTNPHFYSMIRGQS